MAGRKIIFGITDCGRKFPVYENWIKAGDIDIEVIKLSAHLQNESEVEKCDGIILSGGHDVHPRFYKREDYYPLLNPKNIDEQRDVFELKVMEHSQKKNKPLLGICRGLQIANVFFGGTLVRDIPAKYNVEYHDKGEDENDSSHHIHIKPETLLYKISGVVEGIVNSAHHQSADIIAPGLVINSFSNEGIVEGLEWKKSTEKTAMLLVQWHPERITDINNVFGKGIKDFILAEAYKHK